jgi:putative Mg2+ transporter-C (MgtC) family protein
MMQVSTEDFIKIAVSIVLGAFLGLEREYRSKAAGFRTMTMISLGACLFTIVSRFMGAPGSPDRIASNIVQGIGFLGAGVIFKENGSISGLTTATAIWVASAIGMTVGVGNYSLAAATTLGALVVLAGFEYIQKFVDSLNQYRSYKMTFHAETLKSRQLEDDFKRMGIGFTKVKESRDRDQVTACYELRGKASRFVLLDQHLLEDSRILTFDN